MRGDIQAINSVIFSSRLMGGTVATLANFLLHNITYFYFKQNFVHDHYVLFRYVNLHEKCLLKCKYNVIRIIIRRVYANYVGVFSGS